MLRTRWLGTILASDSFVAAPSWVSEAQKYFSHKYNLLYEQGLRNVSLDFGKYSIFDNAASFLGQTKLKIRPNITKPNLT